MGIEKHTLSPWFAHHLLPTKPVGRVSSFLLLLFLTNSLSQYHCQFNLLWGNTLFPHHRLHPLLIFPSQCSRVCSNPWVPWHMDGFHMPFTPPTNLIPCCSLWSVLYSPLSFPLSLIWFLWRSKEPVMPFLHSLKEGVSGVVLGSLGLTLHSIPEVTESQNV